MYWVTSPALFDIQLFTGAIGVQMNHLVLYNSSLRELILFGQFFERKKAEKQVFQVLPKSLCPFGKKFTFKFEVLTQPWNSISIYS